MAKNLAEYKNFNKKKMEAIGRASKRKFDLFHFIRLLCIEI